MPYLCLWRHNFCAAGGVLLWFCQRNWAHPRFLWIIPPAYCQICRKQVYLQHKSKHSFLHRTPLTTYLPTDSEKPPRRGIDMLPPCLAVCFFTVSHGGSISAFKQVPKPTLISALKKKLRREYNLRSVNLRCSKACKPNSNSNALIQGGIAVSFFFIDSAFDLYWLKKAHFHRRDYTTVDAKSVSL